MAAPITVKEPVTVTTSSASASSSARSRASPTSSIASADAPMDSRGGGNLRRRDAPCRGSGAAEHAVAPLGLESLKHARHVAAGLHSDHEEPASGRCEVLAEGGRGGARAVGVVSTVEHDHGLAADDLETAGNLHVGEGLAYHLIGQLRLEEGLRGGHRQRGVVQLVPSVQRHKHIGVASRRECEDRPATRPRPDAARSVPKSRPRSNMAAWGSARNTSRVLGIGLAAHHRRGGLDDAGLLTGHSAAASRRRRRCGPFATLVIVATCASTTLVASKRPSIPTSTTATSTATSAKCWRRGRGHGLEPGGPHLQVVGEAGHVPDRRAEGLGVDGRRRSPRSAPSGATRWGLV